MFDAVRNNKKIVQIFLLLITLPFAFWGVDSYVKSAGDGGALASVGGVRILPGEFQEALHEQQERMRQKLGESFRPEMMAAPAVRKAVLDELINQRLLALDAQKIGLTVSDQAVRAVIAGIPAFQQNGQFSLPNYEALLKAQGMTQGVFESRLRRDMALQQVAGAVAGGALASRTSAERLYSVQLEERSVSEVRLAAQHYAGEVKLAADAARKFYDANRKQFEVPAQLRAEYLVLSQDAVAAQLTVTDEEARKEYEAHPERFGEPEERRVSHILIPVDKSAGEAALKAAREKAEGLLKQVKAHPADFAKFARENSQDSGSAEKGGDLGFFARGAMPAKPLDEAAFAMAREGDISEVVQSDFGLHILRLTGVKGGKRRSFEEVKGELVAELKRAQAARKFAEMGEGFSNTVYEQADSLKPAADKFGLPIRSSEWLARSGEAPAPLNNEKLLNALFSDDAVKNKRNTEAVEVAKGTLVAARVLEFKPAAVRPYEEVKAQIDKFLVQEEAVTLAQKDGEAKLALLKKGEVPALDWSAARSLQRGDESLPPEVTRVVFRAPTDKLPAYAGAQIPGSGFVLFRIEKVSRPTASDSDPRLKAIQQQYARVLAEQDFAAYVASLRKRYDVKINGSALEAAKDR